ncbi:MAG: hypothetical protein DRP09_10340 [Candidatus Thorarchaeota archaeon]|nr:MAG: hypothetical protein DRP09_10340 [Candidatus Thorarchaeota archaeon]
MATIILYTASQGFVSDEALKNNNYLTDLSMSITELEAGSITGDVNAPPSIPGGKVALISLDGKRPNNYYGVFNNFSLINVTESHGEIVKLHQNFSNGWNAFFFGEKPAIYNFSGIFLDTKEYPYYQEFMVAYEKYLRGRKAIENNMQLKMIYDGRIIDGYMLNINTTSTGDVEQTKSFSFSVLIRKSGWVRMNMVPVYSSNAGRYVNTEQFNGMDNSPRLGGELLSGTIETASIDESIPEGFITNTESSQSQNQATT